MRATDVLLVEDDESMRGAIVRILRRTGHRVAAFESAEALLDGLPDASLGESNGCLVCDITLPGISGFELHRRLSQAGPLPPWIFITAQDDAGVRDRAERLQAAYLAKPFEGRALLELVAKALYAK